MNNTKELQSLQQYYNEFIASVSLLEQYYNLYGQAVEVLSEQEELNPTTIQDEVIRLYNSIKENPDLTANLKFIPKTDAKEIVKLGFPANIIHFVKVLITWLGNVVKGFISGTTNKLRTLVNLPEGPKVDKSKLVLDFKKTKDLKPFTIDDIGKNYEVRVLNESEENKNSQNETSKQENKEAPRRETKVMVIDIAKEMNALRELVRHFVSLFENSFGSNHEKLFDTKDLEIVLKLLQDNLKAIEKGKVVSYTVGGGSIDSTVDLSGIKSSLITTHQNVTKLKEAYERTQDKIKDIITILTQKQLYASAQLGTLMKYYNEQTFKELLEIQNFLKGYKKKLVKLEKDMKKLSNKYNKLVNNISELRAPMLALGKTSFQTQYSKRINQLFEASKYMTQIVTLRLSAVSLYVQNFENVNYLVRQAANLNKINS